MTRGVCLQIESQNQLHGGVLGSTYRVCVSILVVAGGRQNRSTTAASVRCVPLTSRADRPTPYPSVRPSAGPFAERTRTRVKQTLSHSARCSLRSRVRTHSRSHSPRPAARPQIYTRAQFIPVDGSDWKRTRPLRTSSVCFSGAAWWLIFILGGVKFCGTSCEKFIQHVL
jgi:hypothetical protein